ncbi:MAG: iron complex outermembrane receptor protein [Phenylobacterium sp.]|jgi:iron complex outermembrane receptor protein
MSIQFKKTVLNLAVCAAIAGALPYTAMAEEQSSQPAADVEIIEVRGIRGQIASSMELKRLADTVKEVITADDIGSLPDKSVTEALQRLPGVTINRFMSNDDPNHFSAEGSGVVIRGLSRTRSEINGRDAFSASANGTGLSYADIPGELLGRIEVVKNTTADLISGGVAGTVNLVTRKPFDSDEQIIHVQVKSSYGDRREEATPSGTFLFSDVWQGDFGSFGALIGVTHSEFKDRGDGVGVDSFYERSVNAKETEYFGENGTAIPGMEDRVLYTPANVAIRSADSDRERDGLVTSLQWANPNKTVEFTVDYIQSDASQNWDERVVQYGEQGFKVNPNNIQFVSGEFDDNGFMTQGEVKTEMLQAASRANRTKTDIEDLSLHLTYQASDHLTVDFDYQRVDSVNSITDYTYTSQQDPTNPFWWTNDGVTDRPEEQIWNTGVEFDLTGGVPNGINYTGDNANPQFPEQAYLRSRMDKEEDNKADSDSFAIDVKYTIDDGWVSAIKAGVYSSQKNQESKDSTWNWSPVSSKWGNGYALSYQTHPEHYESYTFSQSEFFDGDVLNGDQTFLFPNMDSVRNFHAFTDSVCEDSLDCNYLSKRDNTSGSYLDSETTQTSEDRLEFYAQADYVIDDFALPIKGNFGLRYISWQVESTGAISYPAAFGWGPEGTSGTIAENFPEEDAFAGAAEGPRTTAQGDKYSRVLPSFNINVELADDLIARFALSENVYFPTFKNFQNYQNIVASRVLDRNIAEGESNVTAVNFSGNVGNPMIQPEEALNLDLTLEWYFDQAASLNLSLFRKELDNLIRNRLYTANVTNPNPKAGTAAFEEGRSVTMPVDFQTATNQGSGNISGIELSYTQFYDFLPGAFAGLGLSANYTYIKQSGVDDSIGFGAGSTGEEGRNSYRSFNNLSLPGYSDDTFNLALMYEEYDISARLAYSWRSEYLLTRRDGDQFAPVIAQATGQLDMSVSYSLTENLKLGFEASNLLDEVIETELMYSQDGRQTPRSHFSTDRRFGMYLSASF